MNFSQLIFWCFRETHFGMKIQSYKSFQHYITEESLECFISINNWAAWWSCPCFKHEHIVMVIGTSWLHRHVYSNKSIRVLYHSFVSYKNINQALWDIKIFKIMYIWPTSFCNCSLWERQNFLCHKKPQRTLSRKIVQDSQREF